jgi:hypothetical protein
MKKIIERIKADTPAFFKRIIAFAITLGVVATTVKGIDASMDEITLSDQIHTILNYIIFGAAIATGISGTAKEDESNG